jgi:hypothetical protein
MRAGKLITLSAVAALVGGAGLATNLAVGQTSLQSSGSMGQGSKVTGQPLSKRQSIAPSQRTYARANARELGEAGEAGIPPERTRAREVLRTLPRVSSVGTAVRIDAVVPRSVRQAAAPLPPEVQRMHPRFRRDRAFLYRDQVVIVNPTTARIVAIIKTPT